MNGTVKEFIIDPSAAAGKHLVKPALERIGQKLDPVADRVVASGTVPDRIFTAVAGIVRRDLSTARGISGQLQDFVERSLAGRTFVNVVGDDEYRTVSSPILHDALGFAAGCAAWVNRDHPVHQLYPMELPRTIVHEGGELGKWEKSIGQIIGFDYPVLNPHDDQYGSQAIAAEFFLDPAQSLLEAVKGGLGGVFPNPTICRRDRENATVLASRIHIFGTAVRIAAMEGMFRNLPGLRVIPDPGGVMIATEQWHKPYSPTDKDQDVTAMYINLPPKPPRAVMSNVQGLPAMNRSIRFLG